ncbi:MAG: zinc ribbon domain-containing protein [Nanoarchaeota archaeon]|nr:zinc ribbon domain-containing protein [Nanoarchaeota archaeon]
MAGNKCENCGADIDTGWNFCPNCGEEQEKETEAEERRGLFPGFGRYMPFFDMFDSVSGTFRDFDEVRMPGTWSEEPESEEGASEEDERLPGVKFSGIDINITNINGKPDVRVKTFGDFKQYEPEIWEKLGLKKPPEKENRVEVEEKVAQESQEEEQIEPVSRKPMKYEEVKGTNIRRLGDSIIYEFDMPGITDLKNVRINKLESSYEIKAFGEDKAYFKLLPIALDLLNYKVEDEKLVIKFSVGEIE